MLVETGSVDSGAKALGTVSGQTALAYQDAVGRPAYIGLLYFGSTGYNNSSLRSGTADRLLEQTVAWAGTGRAADVPEPGSVALLGLGLAGLVAGRRRRR